MQRRHILSLLASPVLVALAAPLVVAQHSAGPARALADIAKATVIVEGNGQRLLTIFFDPNCPYCHALYKDLRPEVGKNGLQFRWVPVAILTPSSLTKAAALLQAADPLQAFRDNEDNWNFGDSPGGGITPAKDVLPATRAKIDANNALLQSAGSFGVPTLLWRNTQGKVMMQVGPPDNGKALRDLLRSIG
ncbi:MAG: thioredoxin fold domain-containing protein [Thiomonas sp.]